MLGGGEKLYHWTLPFLLFLPYVPNCRVMVHCWISLHLEYVDTSIGIVSIHTAHLS